MADDPPFRTEYAKSNRSSCKSCKGPIVKDSLRMAKMVQSQHFDGKIPNWFHFQCFFARGRGGVTSMTDVGGLGGIRWEDQEKIRAKVEGVAKGATDGSSSSSSAGTKRSKSRGGKQAKKLKEDPQQKVLREQSEAIWRYRDQLQANLTIPQLKEMLEENGQEVPPGESRLLDRCSDGMVFGALQPCDVCQGQLIVRTHFYQCNGNVSGFTKCTVTTKEAKRAPWVIPAYLKENFEFLAKYKYVKSVRVFPDGPPLPEAPPTSSQEASADRASASDGKENDDPTKPLKNFRVVIVGRLPITKANLSLQIKELGGEVTESVSTETTLCISSKAELEKNAFTAKMERVKHFDVPVVGVEFLQEVAKGGALSKIPSHTISSWGAPRQSLAATENRKREGKHERAFEKAPKMKKMTVKGGAIVDPDSGLDSSHHVYQHEKTLYSVVLGMVDIVRGSNSYYKLQVLEPDKGVRHDMCHLFRSWGRVGTSIGGSKIEGFDDVFDAVEEFERLYQEKTGNSWLNRDNFIKRPGKFYPMDIDYGEDDSSLSLASAGSNSKLAPQIQDLVKMIFDIESMKKAMMEFEIDTRKMPLGKLSKRQIQQAYAVLNELQREISGGKDKTKILDGSNRFYTLIPHDFGMQKPPLLDNEDIIKMKTLMLDSLMEIEVAYSLLKTTDDDKGKDPIDAHFEKLKTKMEVLSKDTDEFKMLVEYVRNTHAATHNEYQLEVLEIFKIARHGESKRFKPFSKLNNRMLLWHGSRFTNFVGILSQGLRIAPPEAPVTGYMFGKGVYFADMVSKSANYCRTSPREPTGLMLLCEVALGDIYEKMQAEYVTKLPAGKHSTKGVGRTMPDPNGYKTLESGAVLPMGKATISGVSNTSLLYNEYIVYDVAQINMKYLFKMNFKYR